MRLLSLFVLVTLQDMYYNEKKKANLFVLVTLQDRYYKIQEILKRKRLQKLAYDYSPDSPTSLVMP